MAKTYFQFGPFLGIIGSLDPEMIPDNAAADLSNVLIEDGVVRPRYGYRNLNAAPAGFTTSWGFEYAQGFNTDGSLLQEYLSFELRSGNLYPYSINVATGTRAQIKNGAANQALATPTYGSQPGIRVVVFNGYAYVISPNDALSAGVSSTLYKHSIGVTNSFLPLTPPKAPTKAPVVQFFDGALDTAVSTVDTMAWDDKAASLAFSAVTQTGSFLSVPGSPTDGKGTLILNHNTNGSGADVHDYQQSGDGWQAESVTINLQGAHGPGSQDFTYRDRLILEFKTQGWAIQSQSILASLINGAVITLQPTNVTVLTPSDSTYGNNHFYVVLDFAFKSPRTDFAVVNKFVLSWTTLAAAGTGLGVTPTLWIKPVQLGEVDASAQDDGGNPVNLILAYTYYSSVTGLESPISPTIQLTPKQLKGLIIAPAGANAQTNTFARPKIYLTKNTGAGYDGLYDNYRLWGRRASDTDWFLLQDFGLSSPPATAGIVATGATGAGGSGKTVAGVVYDATANIRCNWNELSTSSVFALGHKGPWNNLVCGTVYKGWVVWGFSGGQGNIQHSAIGNPEALYNTYDLTLLNPSNTSAPANFTLADNGSDDPVAMFPLAQSLIVLGSTGVYAQSGYSPATMTPPKRLPTSLGCAGQYACCLWHEDMFGASAVAFVAKNGEGVWLIHEDPTYVNTVHYRVVELTTGIRGKLVSFLLNGSLSNVAGLRMFVDWTRDALWLVCGTRAMVLRRSSLADQQRHWEFYTYAFAAGQVANVVSEARNRMRWIRTTGQIDENEWNSNSSAWITGALADGGSARPSVYYTTKKLAGQDVTRLSHAEIDREVLTDTPALQAVSSRQTESRTVASGKYFVRFGALQQGREHQFTLTLPDGSAGGVRRLLIEALGPIGSRWRS